MIQSWNMSIAGGVVTSFFVIVALGVVTYILLQHIAPITQAMRDAQDGVAPDHDSHH